MNISATKVRYKNNKKSTTSLLLVFVVGIGINFSGKINAKPTYAVMMNAIIVDLSIYYSLIKYAPAIAISPK